MSRCRKVERRLAQGRRRQALKAKLRLNEYKQALAQQKLQFYAAIYADEMLQMHRDAANEGQRQVIARIYADATGESLTSQLEARIIASLQSQPRGDCDRNQAG